MHQFTSLKGQLLVSLPTMQGDYFSQTVTLLVEHNNDGAFGLIVNRPLNANLGELLANHNEFNFASDLIDIVPLLETGPVDQNRLFFLHSNETDVGDSVAINEEISLSTSPNLLRNVSRHQGPAEIIAGLGYAGWSAGQLENEIKSNVWLLTPYVHEAVFNSSYKDRPQIAANSIGIDLNLIAPTPGHG